MKIQDIITLCDDCANSQNGNIPGISFTAHLCSVESLTGANGTAELNETVKGIEKYIPSDVLYNLGWTPRHPYDIARSKCDECSAPINDGGQLFSAWN